MSEDIKDEVTEDEIIDEVMIDEIEKEIDQLEVELIEINSNIERLIKLIESDNEDDSDDLGACDEDCQNCESDDCPYEDDSDYDDEIIE